MTTTSRVTSDLARLRRETESFLATVDSLPEDGLTAPTLCAGWDRAHVLGHLASNGRALVRLVDWAATGRAQQPYDSPQEREEDIEGYAGLPREELLSAFVASARHFAEQCERLEGTLTVVELDLHGKPVPAASVPAVRITEIVLHHHDLLAGWTLAQAEPDSVLDALEAAVKTMRAKHAPGMTLRTDQGEQWVVGDGAQLVTADRVGLVLWLARGESAAVESTEPLPELPGW